MIVIDVETSGLNAVKHSILSIGAVDFNDPENCFYGECRLREGTLVAESALKINGFRLVQIENNVKSCEDLLKEFLEWTKSINDKTLAGHNVQFDISFLSESFRFYNLDWIFGHRHVDLHSVFYFHMLKNNLSIPFNNNRSNIDLDFIINYLKLLKREGFHNALEDAKLTCKAFSLLLGEQLGDKINPSVDLF